MATTIVWFKTDLRLDDNETLLKAIQTGNQVLPVYIFDDSHFGKTNFGFQKTGNHRFQFLLECLHDLDEQLRQMGSGLVIEKGKPEEILPELAKKFLVKKIFAKKEVAVEEKNTEIRVAKALWQAGCELEAVSSSTLYHAEDLPFTVRDIPDTFTKFRKQVEQECTVRPALEPPKNILSPPIAPFTLPKASVYGLEVPVNDVRSAFTFAGGEKQAKNRLHYYLFESHALATYKETRNGLIGADYSSKLSAWLALGCISSRRIYHEVQRYENLHGANKSTYWLIFELLWRDYFRFVMKKHGKKLFQQTGLKGVNTRLTTHDPALLHRWIDGQTGQPFIDANMRELAATGFMSNRGRQNVASYLCHYLHLDWRYGAAYFEQQLIDYDVSSNWANWAYLAGVGNDPREERVFNPDKQAADYDPKQIYQSLWVNAIPA